MSTAKSIICFFFSSTIYQSLVVRSTAGMWFIGIWVGKDKIFLFYFPSWWFLIHQLLLGHFSYRGLYHHWMIYLVSPLNFVRYFLHFSFIKCVDRYASIVKEKKWNLKSSTYLFYLGTFQVLVFVSKLAVYIGAWCSFPIWIVRLCIDLCSLVFCVGLLWVIAPVLFFFIRFIPY